ncbi:probable glycosyltransferase At5g03795 isoform X2 [Hevea brasiliensis]|uniref:probable glycosyltransferase At5g03795 isoform X2 n=1 Tax=Hevea brasiliensis TaxID=3981 RepID=UPI0025EA7E55|nr:probable glycosyltransferase At5g03795 isoform X2 [Hevea brasiliensis]
MANSSLLLYCLGHRRFSPSFRSFFFIPTCLALFTSLIIIFYISTTSILFSGHLHPSTVRLKPHLSSGSSSNTQENIPLPLHNDSKTPLVHFPRISPLEKNDDGGYKSQRSSKLQLVFNGIYVNNEVFHDRDIFLEDYKQMNRSFKIYVYPHRRDDPFANALLPVDFEPGGNYASESYFKKVLMKSHFITKDPTKADLFFLPFSIARLRHDPRIGVGAMKKAEDVKFNAIQVVCSSSYFLSGHIAHKDASLPQVWPRQEDPPNLTSSKRKKLAFFAGSINSPVRERLLQVWRNDSEISVHFGRLTTPYADKLLGSKFCLHVKGFEVNTARIADSLYYGCVPVIIANHYDLPFTDVLNWKSFSVVVATLDIPLLKKILKAISSDKYRMLQNNVLKVRKHFQWHVPPVDYDAFYMVIYELWLRRSSVRVS